MTKNLCSGRLPGTISLYDVEEQVAREDIREFLDKLIAGGILKADHEDRDNEQDT